MLGQIIMARVINEACGGAVVSPWDVYELPDEWLDTFQTFVEHMRKRQHGA